MLGYLSAETSFLRAFGNRGLFLVFLCVLTRTGSVIGKGSALGISIDLSPGLIAACGPVLALLIVGSLKVEADTLLIAREAVLDDFVKLCAKTKAPSAWTYAMFCLPAVAAGFLTLQFVLKVAPRDAGCADWRWTRQLTDFAYQGGTPSIYCIHDLTEGMPWIYPPLQTFLLIGCVAGCIYLTVGIAKSWRKFRG